MAREYTGSGRKPREFLERVAQSGRVAAWQIGPTDGAGEKHVSREQNALLREKVADASGRMPGREEHFETQAG